MIARLLAAVAALAACHDRPGVPAAPAISTTELDAQWKLAPDGAVFGTVVSPRGLAMIDHAWSDVRAFMAATPELVPALGKLIIAAAPSSPLAADVRAGDGGLMLPTAMIGVMTAVATPAFTEYMQRSAAMTPAAPPM